MFGKTVKTTSENGRGREERYAGGQASGQEQALGQAVDLDGGSTLVDGGSIATLRGMTDDQLKRLSRVELLEIMVAQARELEATREQLKTTERQLRANQIALEQVAAVAHTALGRGEDPRSTQRAVDEYEKKVADSASPFDAGAVSKAATATAMAGISASW